MIEISTVEDIAALRESSDVECKAAQGRHGNGAFPNDAWETYSAFANTSGGDIFLGLQEIKTKDGEKFKLEGIKNTGRVIDDFWACLNNRTKVSNNILSESNVRVLTIDEKNIIHIHIPQASRVQKPIFINNNPMSGTYKRLNSGDFKQDEITVSRMMAEKVEDSRDTEILRGYELDDLAIESLNTYRQLYSNRNPDHPWNQIDNIDFLYKIGGWNRNRELGYSGLTRAGLLMFGDLRAIKNIYPNYMLDYQERPEAKTEARWVDRFTVDGTWSGNLFDFYRQVIRKLSADIKVPFSLEGDQRQDDTAIHKALREALVNTLVHADYTGRASILVVKRPDMFGFRNPGLMRVPIELAINGGESDCRNRLIQDMFRYIGLGENAGSGLPKIYTGWSSQHWRSPALQEKTVPSDQTLLEMHTLTLVPDNILEELRVKLGKKVFDSLGMEERLILVTAKIEKTVNHRRMMEILDVHPYDLRVLFAGLVEKGLLHHSGNGKGTVYFFSEEKINDLITEMEELTNKIEKVARGREKEIEDEESSGGLGRNSGGLGRNSGGLEVNHEGLSPKLLSIAEVVSNSRKAPKPVVEKVILQLCAVQALSLEQLIRLLQRSESVVRKDYLAPLIKSKKLRFRYPTTPNHPSQAYITETKES